MPIPLIIENKEDSPEQLSLIAGQPTKFFLFASEINAIVAAIQSKAYLVDGKVPAELLPSYVDDVLEFSTFSAFPTTGAQGKIYVVTTGVDANKQYRWGGTGYIELSNGSAVWGSISGTIANQTDLMALFNAKQDLLVSGTNIKTINGVSILGSGDVEISANIGSLEFNTTDKTVWNNGKGNVITNTSFGEGALKNNTTGSANSAFGGACLQSVTSSSNNSAFGYQSLVSATSGDNNSAFGLFALRFLTTGWSNTAIGTLALTNNNGNNNVSIGYGSGEIISNGSALTNANNSVFIGNATRAFDNNQTNQIVIGFSAIGAGSNTATLGNTLITKTILRGTINTANMPVFADNAAAIAGGISVGDQYRTTTGELRIRI